MDQEYPTCEATANVRRGAKFTEELAARTDVSIVALKGVCNGVREEKTVKIGANSRSQLLRARIGVCFCLSYSVTPLSTTLEGSKPVRPIPILRPLFVGTRNSADYGTIEVLPRPILE